MQSKFENWHTKLYLYVHALAGVAQWIELGPANQRVAVYYKWTNNVR